MLTTILKKAKLNERVEKAGINTEKTNISGILVNIVYAIIAVFFVVQALNTLQLSILTNIGAQIIAYLPFAISATIVILLAFLLGVAFAIAFGYGSREFAQHTMKKLEQKLEDNKRKK